MKQHQRTLLNGAKPLSEITSTQGIRLTEPVLSPGSHCPMHTALNLSAQIRGLSTLVVGMPECGTYSRVILESPYGEDGELHWSYTLSSNETVFGCSQGVIEALTEMDRAGAKAILLMLTCIPELIGEDLEAIVHQLQPKIKAQLIPIQIAHFRCISFPSGFTKTWTGLGSLMQPRPGVKGKVNILGLPQNSARGVWRDLLERDGVEIRWLGPGSSLDDFINAPDAMGNIVCSPFVLPLAELMHERWAMPYLPLHHLYGAQPISQAMNTWAEKLGLGWRLEIERQRQALAEQEYQAQATLKDARFAIALRLMDCLPLSAYLAELGLDPVFLHMEEFFTEDLTHARRLLATGQNPLVGHFGRGAAASVRGLQPDLLLGMPFDRREGIAAIPDIDQLDRSHGFERSLKLLELLLSAVSAERDVRYGA